jgi:hypothetical protein
MFITPRFFVVRSVGSPEPLFLLLILLSVYAFLNKNFLLAGLWGALATATKSPGILLFISYFATAVSHVRARKDIDFRWAWLLLIPAGLGAVFYLYFIQYGTFDAYFKSGDNIHLVFPPFAVFNYQKEWIQTAWLEDVLIYFFFYLFAILTFFKNEKLKPIFYFMVVFFLAIISVQHRDISRYSLPLLPFALIAFEKFFTSKKFLICLILLLPAIYLYSWNFLIYNTAPIGDWTPFL